MSDAPRIIYTSRPDATPEAERAALAEIYKFVLAKKKAARPGGHDDVRKDQNAHTATKNYTD
jgi:hypothetical protein